MVNNLYINNNLYGPPHKIDGTYHIFETLFAAISKLVIMMIT